MHARVLFLGLAWMALALGQAQEVPSPAPQAAASQEQLDGGLLEPAWFGPPAPAADLASESADIERFLAS